MDRISKEHRSWNMSRIKSRDTKPELIVRSMLHRMGYRFRVHVRTLPGKPDIVLPKYRTVIFVHGCFWHRHKRCKYAYMPKTRQEFWRTKFAANQRHDANATIRLRHLRWRVLVIWECQLRSVLTLETRLAKTIPVQD